MPDITNTVFSIVPEALEDYDPFAEDSSGGGGKSRDPQGKTSRVARKTAVDNAQQNRKDQAKERLQKVLAKFPEFDSEDERVDFLERYVGWVQACIETGEAIVRDLDIDFDFFRSGGPGGQNVNKINSGVRVTHLPTNIFVENTEAREQLKNKENALGHLYARLEHHIEDWRLYLSGSALTVDLIEELYLFD